jgi:hypothetical protein
MPVLAAEPPNIINHVFMVGDMSPSMHRHKAAFVGVYDRLVAHLASRSRELDQETRISTYLFAEAGTERCVVWDKDVLRMPSIEGLYRPDPRYGRTALIDATMLAIGDLKLISQKYGDHSVLFFDITDGEENHSRNFGPRDLNRAISAAPENETYACLVPNRMGVAEAKRHGFPEGNIEVWDTASAHGVEQMGKVVRDAADMFMEGRASGIRGYSASSGGGLFRMRSFSAADVRHQLTPMTPGSYYFLDVTVADCGGPRGKVGIERFFDSQGYGPYPKGKCYYQFTDTAVVQSYKNIAIENGGDVYSGTLDQVRGFVGLPEGAEIKVKPEPKPGMTVFIQSTSHNRNLFPGTRLLVFR